MRSATHFLRYSSLKCSTQTFTVRSAIVNSSYFVCHPLRGERGNWKKLFLSCGRFQSLLVAFRNSKTCRHSEIKQTRPSRKKDFSGEAFAKQNTEASLALLSCNSPRAPTKWSAIFAFGVLDDIFVISRIIKVEVTVICRSRRLRVITLTKTLITLNITKTKSNIRLLYYTWNEKVILLFLHWQQATQSLQTWHGYP